MRWADLGGPCVASRTRPESTATRRRATCWPPASQFGEARRRSHPGPDSKPASEPTTDPSSKPASEATTDRDPPRRVSQCAPHLETIEHALANGRNLTSIWQELVDCHGFPGSYESVKRFARRLLPDQGKVAHPRIETAAGVEAQVDYGEGPMVRHPGTGKHRRTRLFALTLGYSRKAVFLLTWKSSSKIWCELHEEAFRRLGGTPRTIVLDNLKEGVLAANAHDPTLDPLYRDVLKHYGVVPLPARVRHPDRKGKVESSVGFAQKTPLRGMRFDSLEDAQCHLDQWNERWADTRIHGTTKQQVAEMLAGRSYAFALCPSRASATTSTARPSCTPTAASILRGPTTACHLAGSDRWCTCVGTNASSASSIRRTAS